MDTDWQAIIYGAINTITFIIMLISLFGLIVPIFPGGVLIWVAALVYGLATGFTALGGWMFFFITILMIVSALADNVFMATKGRQAGASWGNLILAFLLGLIGGIFLTPLGGLGAAVLALFLLERRRLGGDTDKAVGVIKALMQGYLWAFVIRFGLGIVKIGLWAIWAANVT
ncbi:MAG: DUF456 domain-containing protein [Anaerolineae bacterium]|nr:MAG: DUF456 domain-containing protein [Anaerolineae bacterium]